jgi:hypothetical protein
VVAAARNKKIDAIFKGAIVRVSTMLSILAIHAEEGHGAVIQRAAQVGH